MKERGILEADLFLTDFLVKLARVIIVLCYFLCVLDTFISAIVLHIGLVQQICMNLNKLFSFFVLPPSDKKGLTWNVLVRNLVSFF